MLLRKALRGILDSLMTTTTFTGLYAFWKPYWLDSEPIKEIKRLVNPKQFWRGENPDIRQASAISGEDAFLLKCMIKKHKCIYLRDIGCVDLGVSTEKLPYVQYMIGQHFARQDRSIIVSLGRTFLRAQPHYLQGYLMERRK